MELLAGHKKEQRALRWAVGGVAAAQDPKMVGRSSAASVIRPGLVEV